MRSIFQMFAGYNGWANARLYAAAAQLPDAEYRADHGAFFKSVAWHAQSSLGRRPHLDAASDRRG
jgi:uncharacterized damage-inducible protein DinB